jgi:hypothetical protein
MKPTPYKIQLEKKLDELADLLEKTNNNRIDAKIEAERLKNKWLISPTKLEDADKEAKYWNNMYHAIQGYRTMLIENIGKIESGEFSEENPNLIDNINP